MNKEELKKLEDKISYLTSALDAAIDDYFKFDNSGETKETEKIHEHLNIAWDSMDSALDELQRLIKGAISLKEQTSPVDPSEPEPVLSEETFRAILRNTTEETIREANKAVVFFGNQLDDEDDNKLSAEAKGVFMAALLIEYGKLTANKKEHGRAADPEEKQQGLP